jgi:hypothetical protein
MSESSEKPIIVGPKLERDAKGRVLPGSVLNPNGRPKGSGLNIKDAVRQYLEEHPGEKREFIEHFIKNNRELAWQMLEGKPQQDITSGGEKLPTPLLANLPNVPDNNSNPEDSSPQESA